MTISISATIATSLVFATSRKWKIPVQRQKDSFKVPPEFYTFHERMSPKVNDGLAMRTDKRGKKHKGIVAERLKVLSKTRRCKVLSHVP